MIRVLSHRIAHRLVLAAAVLFIGLAGVGSARHMAPDADEVMRAQTALLLGAAAAELCEQEHAVHDHRCPFCHLLPQPPRVRFAPRAERLAFTHDAPLLRALTDAPQAALRHGHARAPPALA